jgi:hypothetical protein
MSSTFNTRRQAVTRKLIVQVQIGGAWRDVLDATALEPGVPFVALGVSEHALLVSELARLQVRVDKYEKNAAAAKHARSKKAQAAPLIAPSLFLLTPKMIASEILRTGRLGEGPVLDEVAVRLRLAASEEDLKLPLEAFTEKHILCAAFESLRSQVVIDQAARKKQDAWDQFVALNPSATIGQFQEHWNASHGAAT